MFMSMEDFLFLLHVAYVKGLQLGTLCGQLQECTTLCNTAPDSSNRKVHDQF